MEDNLFPGRRFTKTNVHLKSGSVVIIESELCATVVELLGVIASLYIGKTKTR
tara:strand:+ start:557 stop:715 length:159 start_codon:yes stop_codon:yes gene_type:complete